MDADTSSNGDTSTAGRNNSRHNMAHSSYMGSILDSNSRGTRRNKPENRTRSQNAPQLGLPSASPPQVPVQLGLGEDAVSYKQLDENTLIVGRHTFDDQYGESKRLFASS